MKETKVSVVKSTTLYDTFYKNDFQPRKRAVPSKGLLQSIKDTGGNILSPILIDKKTNQIIDGHRRLHACKLLSVPVYYIMVEMDSDINRQSLIQTMSSTSSAWTTKLFVDSHSISKPEYMDLLDFLDENGASIELVKRFGGVTDLDIKAGIELNLDYDRLEKARKTAIFIVGLFDIELTKSIRALFRVDRDIKGFDTDKLIDKLEKNAAAGTYDTLIMTSNTERLYNILLKAYNSRPKASKKKSGKH